MPRTTKEKTEKQKTEKVNKKDSKVSKSSTSKKDTPKAKKTTTAKATTKKATSVSATKNKTTSKKKNTMLKETKSKKKTVSSNNKKAITKRKTVKTSNISSLLPEYYDLPYKYNQTIVKILAQTPQKLFVYWEISDDDRKHFIEQYGENFFSVTKPVLIIHNLSMNYTFEIDINDFANSWYLNINDADCLYGIELGRRPFEYTEKIQTPYIYISASNNLQTPNNHILFEKIRPDTTFKFKNIKNKNITTKSLANVSFFANAKGIYNVNSFYEFYKKFYGEDFLEELANNKLNNPSSGAISSFK